LTRSAPTNNVVCNLFSYFFVFICTIAHEDDDEDQPTRAKNERVHFRTFPPALVRDNLHHAVMMMVKRLQNKDQELTANERPEEVQGGGFRSQPPPIDSPKEKGAIPCS